MLQTQCFDGTLAANRGGTQTSPQMVRFPNIQVVWKLSDILQVWHNIAFGIDFGAGSVTFYHSTGADPLVQTAGPVSTSTSSVSYLLSFPDHC